MKRIKPVLIALYIVALIVSGVLSVAYYMAVRQHKPSEITKLMVRPDIEKVLTAGTIVDEDVYVDAFTAVRLPEDASNAFEFALDGDGKTRELLKGLVLTRDLHGGEFLQPQDFAVSYDKILEAKITKGHRALSLPVRPSNAVGVAIAPGSVVDVMLTKEDRETGVTTQKLMCKVKLMAVGDYISPEAYVDANRPSFSTVVVQVPKEQVEFHLTEIAQSRGALTLVLVGRDNTEDCGEG